MLGLRNEINTLELADLSHEVHNLNQREENRYRLEEIFFIERIWKILLTLTSIMNNF